MNEISVLVGELGETSSASSVWPRDPRTFYIQCQLFFILVCRHDWVTDYSESENADRHFFE